MLFEMLDPNTCARVSAEALSGRDPCFGQSNQAVVDQFCAAASAVFSTCELQTNLRLNIPSKAELQALYRYSRFSEHKFSDCEIAFAHIRGSGAGEQPPVSLTQSRALTRAISRPRALTRVLSLPRQRGQVLLSFVHAAILLFDVSLRPTEPALF